MEILDHIILSVEAILEEDKTISFEDAVVKARVEGFGKMSFNEIVEDRLQIMNKAHRIEYGKYLKTYFTFPYFLMTLSVFTISYFVINILETPRKVVAASMILTVLFPLMDWTIKQYKFKKKNNRKVLKMENFRFVYGFIFIWLGFTNFYFGFEFDKIMNVSAYNAGGAILITMSFLSFLFYLKLSKKITEELQQQIFA
jgi:hypothetical protein